ncbi:MAG TPA: hypothetical protein VH877_05915 [Polyangia bacterium]|jgi:hypothetical protein|nr:hypothetical protein [Polyangia bacterium]
MAELMLGVLAEDLNDCDVIDTLVGRIFAERQIPAGRYKVHKRGSQGCAKLRRKAEPWMRELATRGCRHIILVHDRDRHDEAQLRAQLSALAVPGGVERHVCIPVEEIEAWFFASSKALELICREDAARHVHSSPHLIRSPKEKLKELSLGANRKPRHSENDNAKLAEVLELDACARRCAAFRELRSFLHQLAQRIGPG